eukprot:scaffold85_cov175-Ochromonas_danica.AAC.1
MPTSHFSWQIGRAGIVSGDARSSPPRASSSIGGDGWPAASSRERLQQGDERERRPQDSPGGRGARPRPVYPTD